MCLTEIAVREPSVRDREGVEVALVVRHRACAQGLSVLLFTDADCGAPQRGLDRPMELRLDNW